MSTFITALVIMARKLTQPICPPTDEQTRKMSHIYTMGYYSIVKKTEITKFESKLMKLEKNILR